MTSHSLFRNVSTIQTNKVYFNEESDATLEILMKITQQKHVQKKFTLSYSRKYLHSSDWYTLSTLYLVDQIKIPKAFQFQQTRTEYRKLT